MKIFFADTNIFLRFILNDIPDQVKYSEKYFKQAKNGEIQLIICQIIVFEIVFVLENIYNFPKAEIISAVGKIIKTPFFTVEDKESFLEALNLYAVKNMDFVDIFLFCKAKSQNGKILTFDKHFKKLL